jgi:hypothetical protein
MEITKNAVQIIQAKKAKYLSGRRNALEFSGIALFEASLVAFDPLIDHLSHGGVLMKVIFNAGLAFAIFTAHHFLEERLNS